MTTADLRQLREGEGVPFYRGLPPVDLRVHEPWELGCEERRAFDEARAAYDSAAAVERVAREEPV